MLFITMRWRKPGSINLVHEPEPRRRRRVGSPVTRWASTWVTGRNKAGAWRKMKTGKPVNVEAAKPQPEKTEKPEARDAANRATGHRKGEVRLGREVQARIGQQLRAMYDEVVREGVPPHIAELVRRLSEQDDGTA
jgi:hypothetical protein